MTIKVFSTPSCPYCVTLKEFLKEKGFSFEDIDVSKNQQVLEEIVKKTGQYGVPVVDIDGQIVVGFNREKIVQLLGMKD